MDPLIRKEASSLLLEFLESGAQGGDRSSVDVAQGLAISLAPVPKWAHGMSSSSWAGRRMAEFSAGRKAARDALDLLGGSRMEPLVALSSGAVHWPDGYRGSISHCCHLAVAAVSFLDSDTGIDIERIQPFSPPMVELMSTAREETAMESLRDLSADTKASVHFSAKEAAFKAMSPNGAVTSIREIQIACHPAAAGHGTFIAESAGGLSGSGYYATGQGMVLTLCVVSDTAYPASGPAAPRLPLAAAQ